MIILKNDITSNRGYVGIYWENGKENGSCYNVAI